MIVLYNLSIGCGTWCEKSKYQSVSSQCAIVQLTWQAAVSCQGSLKGRWGNSWSWQLSSAPTISLLSSLTHLYHLPGLSQISNYPHNNLPSPHLPSSPAHRWNSFLVILTKVEHWAFGTRSWTFLDVQYRSIIYIKTITDEGRGDPAMDWLDFPGWRGRSWLAGW